MTVKPKIKGKIVIETELCKACGFCGEYCPKGSIRFSSRYNQKGYYPAEFFGEECTGCAICALVCPEAIIEVWRE